MAVTEADGMAASMAVVDCAEFLIEFKAAEWVVIVTLAKAGGFGEKAGPIDKSFGRLETIGVQVEDAFVAPQIRVAQGDHIAGGNDLRIGERIVGAVRAV